MSFFKSLKRGLGFYDSDETADETLYADTAEDTGSQTMTAAPPMPAVEIEPVKFDAARQDLIFEQVVKVFNDTMPAFVSTTVDSKAQIKYLRDALDAGTRAYLESLGEQARQYCEARWQQTRESMNIELEALKTKAGDIEKRSADMQQKQLSSDRQRRALSDRVHDLEAQVARMEAEREQFELENRSLVNRLKVAGVQQEDVDSARAEIERLNAEIKKLRETPGAGSQAEADALRIQIDEMSTGIDSLKEQTRVANEMLEDMRKNLAAANKRVAERDRQLAEANSLNDQYCEAMEKKMVEIDEVIAGKNDKIKTLQAMVAERESVVESLRQTIADNLRKQARREKEMQEHIDRLTPSATTVATEAVGDTAPATSAETLHHNEETAPVISEDDLTAIEKTFESEDWLSSTPPAETPSMRPAADDPDFGYREPPHHDRGQSSNPSQLSLF